MKNKLERNNSFTYAATILAVTFISLVGAYIEYNYILIWGLPFREAKPPTFAFLYNYDLVFFLPMILIVAFTPTIHKILTKHSLTHPSIRKPLAFSVAITMLGLIIKDAGWFIIRSTAPLATDPLAGQFIRSTDYTASFIGYVQILGVNLPLWYLILAVPIAAIFISIAITRSEQTPSQ